MGSARERLRRAVVLVIYMNSPSEKNIHSTSGVGGEKF